VSPVSIQDLAQGLAGVAGASWLLVAAFALVAIGALTDRAEPATPGRRAVR
jgi:hypothetical protein